MTTRYGLGMLIIAVLLCVAPFVGATEVGVLTVDGVGYAPSKISGPTVHYETPDVNPSSAFTERNVWTGNGSEWLPCEGGIHWIDNENVLTISNCLENTTTTTTEPPTTTSTGVTTSTTPTTSTSTVPTTTTSTTTTTTVPPSTTTTTSTTIPQPELPFTGSYDTMLVGLGLGFALCGGLLLLAGRLRDE